MATNRTINGVTYQIPDQGDNYSWGSGLSGWVGAVTNGALFKSGGLFQLTAEVDFGASYGLKSLYWRSRAAAVANTGSIRLANTDSVVFAGNTAGDVSLTVTYGNAVLSNTGFDAGGNAVANVASPTVSTQAATKGYVDGGIANAQPAYSNVGILTGNTSINCAANIYQDVMLASNPTITFENAEAAGKVTTLTVYVRQSANGGNTVTWSNTIRWSDNTAPVLSTAPNTADMFTFVTWDGGTIWMGLQAMGNVPLANIW